MTTIVAGSLEGLLESAWTNKLRPLPANHHPGRELLEGLDPILLCHSICYHSQLG